MGRRAKLLELLYEAPRTNRALHVVARRFMDQEMIQRVHEARNRASGSRSVMLTATREGAPPADADRHELWWAEPGRWRYDHHGTVMIADRDELSTYSEAMGVIARPGRQAFPNGFGMLEPRSLASMYDIELRGRTRTAGRRAYQVRLRQVHGVHMDPAAMVFGPGPWLGDQATCEIDAATGVILTLDARFEGERCSSWSTEAFETPRALAPEVFVLATPDGRPVRSMTELHAEHLRRMGVDLGDVEDLDDRGQLNDALRRHHERQFHRDPTSMAAQHVPVGPPPEDEAAAAAQVREVFERIVTPSNDGEAVPAVEGGANLGSSLREAGERAPGGDGPVDVRVELVKFLSPDTAVVWFALERAGRALLGTLEGRAHRHGDRWLVSRPTFAMIVGSVGVQCPPPPDQTG
jgi:hypothetical protein